MTANQIVVGEGDRVKLEITSSSPAELHMHGYGLEQEGELAFDATIIWGFEIEDHDTETTPGELLVQPR